MLPLTTEQASPTAVPVYIANLVISHAVDKVFLVIIVLRLLSPSVRCSFVIYNFLGIQHTAHVCMWQLRWKEIYWNNDTLGQHYSYLLLDERERSTS